MDIHAMHIGLMVGYVDHSSRKTGYVQELTAVKDE